MNRDPITVDGEPWTVDEVRSFATDSRDRHERAGRHGRCAVCHYVKHPCDTFNLASIVLALLPGTETP